MVPSSTPPKLKILYNTTFFRQPMETAFGFHPRLIEDLCVVTSDRKELEAADAVIFHIPDVKEPLPTTKRPGQYWVSVTMESQANYPQQGNAEFMRQFDLRMDYRKDADVQMLYVPGNLAEVLSPPKWKFRRYPVVYFASNNHAHNNRFAIVEELKGHLKIDSYGKSQNNRKIFWDKGRATKLRIISRYHFYLAFENTNEVDYVSEKVYDGLVAGTVPVYLGASNVDDYMPADKCIIKVSDFRSVGELGKYLNHLQNNRAEYESYLAWKRQPLRKSFLDLVNWQHQPTMRQLCYKLIDRLKK